MCYTRSTWVSLTTYTAPTYTHTCEWTYTGSGLAIEPPGQHLNSLSWRRRMMPFLDESSSKNLGKASLFGFFHVSSSKCCLHWRSYANSVTRNTLTHSLSHLKRIMMVPHARGFHCQDIQCTTNPSFWLALEKNTEWDASWPVGTFHIWKGKRRRQLGFGRGGGLFYLIMFLHVRKSLAIYMESKLRGAEVTRNGANFQRGREKERQRKRSLFSILAKFFLCFEVNTA